MINKNFLTKVTYANKNSATVDPTIQKRVFEYAQHNIDDLLDFDYCYASKDSIAKKTNSLILSYYEDIDRSNQQRVFFNIASSSIYDVLLNSTIPTTSNEEKHASIFLYKIKVTIDSKADALETIKIMSVFSALSLDLDAEILLHADVYNYINSTLNNIKIDLIKKFPINVKKIAIESIRNPYDILSTTIQDKLKLTIYSILSHASQPNPSDMNTLQHYLLEQQIRMSIYATFAPIIHITEIQFTRTKYLADPLGCLFITAILFKESSELTFKELFFYFLDYGIIPSYENLEKNVFFDPQDNTNQAKKVQLIRPPENSICLPKNPCNPLLFRLLDNQLIQVSENLDEAIVSNNVDKILFEIKKII